MAPVEGKLNGDRARGLEAEGRVYCGKLCHMTRIRRTSANRRERVSGHEESEESTDIPSES